MKLMRQRIYIASLVAVLAVGLGGAMSTKASALSLGDVTNALTGVLGLSNNNKSETTPTTTKGDNNAPVAQPAQAAPSQPTTAPPVTTTTTQQPTVVQTSASPKLSATPVEKVETVTPATKDTGAIVEQVASAQTAKSIAPVVYTSNQNSSEVRDELFAIAAVVTIIGAASYGMTFAATNPTPAVARRPLYVK